GRAAAGQGAPRRAERGPRRRGGGRRADRGAAAHWFAAALRLLPAPGDDAARARRARLLVEEATAAGAAGRLSECRAAVDELLALAPPAMAQARAQLVAFRAFVDHLSGRLDDARDLVRRE